jgi:hypothetical protein
MRSIGAISSWLQVLVACALTPEVRAHCEHDALPCSQCNQPIEELLSFRYIKAEGEQFLELIYYKDLRLVGRCHMIRL